MPFIAEFSQGSAPGNARKPLPAEEAFPGWAQAISGEVLTGKSGVGNTGSRLWAPGHWPLVTTGHSCLIPASRALPHIPEALLCYNTEECSGLSELIWCIGLWFRYFFLSLLLFNCPYPLDVASLNLLSLLFSDLTWCQLRVWPGPGPCRRRSQLCSPPSHRRSLLSPLPALESSDPCSVRAQCAPVRVTTNITSPEHRAEDSGQLPARSICVVIK